MKFRNFMLLIACLALTAPVTFAQAAPNKPKPSMASGEQMFMAYCASCHGKDGKGNGPASSALKTPATDLTSLSKHNGGKFPNFKVAHTIQGESTVSAHGSREMPVWGEKFWQASEGHPAEVQLRIKNLTDYVESLQSK